ncbi:hypothetical protein [Neptuniibacter halophilus]|uniref:hypothetical protein n=1 Tax=Neptuniibacter halophilus TaxID=651666 RepID=UPI0025744627|nr:hypothetical protein [Neptuniibacter halophilus]
MSNIFFYDFFEAAYRDAKRAYPDLCHEHEKAWESPVIADPLPEYLYDLELIKSFFKSPDEYISHCSKEGVAIHPVVAVPIAVGCIPKNVGYLRFGFQEMSEVRGRDTDISVREIYGRMFYEYELAREECSPRDKDFTVAVEFLDSLPEVDRPKIKPETLIRYRNLWVEQLDRKKLD